MAAIKSLSLRVADGMDDWLDTDGEFTSNSSVVAIRSAEDAPIQDAALAIALILSGCEKLQELDLSCYHLEEGLDTQRMLQQIIVNKLSKLRKCCLRGILTECEMLLEMIGRLNLVCLTLDNVYVASGRFRAIFDHCTRHDTTIRTLHLEDLFEVGQGDELELVLFDVRPRGPSSFIRGKFMGRNILRTEEEDVKLPIVYHVHHKRIPSSPQQRNWRLDGNRKFGTPILK